MSWWRRICCCFAAQTYRAYDCDGNPTGIYKLPADVTLEQVYKAGGDDGICVTFREPLVTHAPTVETLEEFDDCEACIDDPGGDEPGDDPAPCGAPGPFAAAYTVKAHVKLVHPVTSAVCEEDISVVVAGGGPWTGTYFTSGGCVADVFSFDVTLGQIVVGLLCPWYVSFDPPATAQSLKSHGATPVGGYGNSTGTSFYHYFFTNVSVS